jgi:NAD(P)-dependent dehydrogenase (short-subunit alcohol dehydrogenase family)
VGTHEDGGGVVVVTGAGSGLGRAMATALLRDGFRVALLGRTQATLEETAGASADAMALRCDVTDGESVRAAFAAVVDRWARVDVLVNNAGSFGPQGEPDEISVQDWDATMAVNLRGSFLCAREAFGVMRRQDPRGGRIINNGSISAQVPRPGSIAYTASKHAVTGLSRSLSLDGRRHGIVCTQVDIGNAATELTAGFADGALQPDGTRRPEPTFDASHVADAVVQLARLPLDVSVPWLTMVAAGMPYAGRG